MLIYWIRNDFRFIDNEALNYFRNYDGKKICCYSYNEKKFKDRSAQKWWLYKSLTNFRNNLEEIENGKIISYEECQRLELLNRLFTCSLFYLLIDEVL